MARCQQCGTEFSNWFGDIKQLCPRCEQSARRPQPEVLPPDAPTQPAQPRMKLPPPVVTRILIGINVAVFVAMVVTTRQFFDFDIPTALRWGADFGPATTSGEWWRMLTSMFLHGGILHVAVNMWALRNLGYTAELFYGRKNFTIIYLLSGFAGSSATLIWRPDEVSVGASGAIFGVAGALAAMVYFKKLPVDRAVLRRDMGSIGGVIIFNLLLGSSIPVINNAAHVGGLIAGMILGYALPAMIFRAEREKPVGTEIVAIAIVLALIVGIGYSGHTRLAAEREVYRAQKAIEAGDENAALHYVEVAASLHPRTFYANSLIGAFYLAKGRSAEAIPFLEKALQMDPHNGRVKQALQAARNAAK